MLINLPFQDDMRHASLRGYKTATSRTKRYGKAGDTFYILGVLFEIMAVRWLRLIDVAAMHHKEEGFDSYDAFVAKWRTLHPRKGYVPEQKVFFHKYRLLPPQEGE